MLLDRPQIVEGSVIVNVTVPYGTSDPANPNVGELFYRTDLGQLRAYGNGGWVVVSTGTDLSAHASDNSLHLTSAQNSLLDGLNATLTSAELNYVDGVTSPIQTQIDNTNSALNTHTSDAALHVTAAQNTFLDALNLPTLTAASVNALPAHLADYTMHLTSAQNTLIDGITVTSADINSIPTVTSNLSSLTSTVNTHIADYALHMNAAQNLFLDAITVGSVDVNRLTGIDTYLTSIGSASIASSLSTLFSTKLDKSGGTMTGNIVMSAGSKITGLPLPTLDTDAASKAYVDAMAGGIDWKQAVKAATTAAITLSGLQTVDGVSLVANDRVLVKNQADASTNGIYLVASGAWSRATDYDSALEISQSAVYVLAGGTTNGRSSFVQTSNITTFPGDAISFTPFSGPVVNAAGNGISFTGGGTVSVKEGAGIAFDGSTNVTVDLYSGGGLMTTVDGTNSSTTTTAQLSLTKVGTAGTYKSVTTDAHGRVTGGTNPTTLSGFGITDAVLKSGDTMTGTLNLPSNGLVVGTNQLVVSGGNIGIGMSPTGSYKVEVLGNYAASGGYYTTSADGYLWASHASGILRFGTANAERMRIDTSGSLIIGATSKTSSEKALISYSAANVVPRTLQLHNPNTTAGTGNAILFSTLSNNGALTDVAFISGVATSTTGDGALVFSTAAAGGTAERARIDWAGNLVVGTGALATTATNGFLYLASMPGAPTGVPTSYTGRVPMAFNTANNILYFYNGSSWVGTGASSVAFTSLTGLPIRTNWNSVSGAYDMVVGQLAWKQFGNNHTIFDASAGTSPSGTAVNNTDASIAWTATYPTLMGWNGTSTYGVRVDRARLADNVNSISSAVGGTYTWTGIDSFRSNSDTGAQGVNTNPTGLRAFSDNSSGAIMSFHRSGQYAVNMGLDSDNVFRIGGWSAPANLLQLDMAGLLTVPSLKASSVFNNATYTFGANLSIASADATAGKRALLTLPAGEYSGEVVVYTNRSTNDSSSNTRAAWKFKIVRGGGATGSFAFFNVESSEEDYNVGAYQWYFDSGTGNAYLRFGQASNTYSWYVETNLAGSSANITPTLVLDTGTVPTGTTLVPSRSITAGTAGQNVMVFSTGGSERVRIDNVGNVLVGSASAAARMYVVGSGSGDTLRVDNSTSSSTIVICQTDALGTNTTARPVLSLQRGSSTSLNLSADGSTQGVVYYDAVSSTGQHIFSTNAVERMRIDNVGGVSIGGVSPVETLTIGSTTNSTNVTVGLRTRTSASAVTRALVTQGADTGSLTVNWDVGGVGSESALILRGASSERLRIANTGKISASSAVAGDVMVQLQNTSSTGNGLRIDGGSNSSTYALSVRNSSGSELMQVNGAGAVAINAAPVSNTKLFVSGAVAQNVTAVAATTIDWSAGNYFTKTISGATAFTFTNVPVSGFAMITLKLTNGGSAAITWPTIKWSGGTAPTFTTAGIDIINLFTDDGGTTIYGILAGKGMA